MSREVELLRSSFQLVLSREPDVTARFYNELFTQHPEARPLFERHKREVQERMLADALSVLMDHLEDAVWSEQHLGRLGARHAEYGVVPQLYEKFGDSLIATFRHVAGQDWTEEHEAAWRDACAGITQLMLAGYSRPEATAKSGT